MKASKVALKVFDVGRKRGKLHNKGLPARVFCIRCPFWLLSIIQGTFRAPSMASHSDASKSPPMFLNNQLQTDSEETAKSENEVRKTGSSKEDEKPEDDIGLQEIDDTVSDIALSGNSGDLESEGEYIHERSQDLPPESTSETNTSSLDYSPTDAFSPLCEVLNRLNATLEGLREDLKNFAKENSKKDLGDEPQSSE